jgi:hypothetical protein
VGSTVAGDTRLPEKHSRQQIQETLFLHALVWDHKRKRVKFLEKQNLGT